MYQAQTRRRGVVLNPLVLAAALLATTRLVHAQESLSSNETRIWTCSYVAPTPRGPLQITAKFQVMGDELAEIDTVPKDLNFSERYKILENTSDDIVAAISIAKLGDHPPAGIGAIVIVIAKQNGQFQTSGVILGLRISAPTLGHCDNR